MFIEVDAVQWGPEILLHLPVSCHRGARVIKLAGTVLRRPGKLGGQRRAWRLDVIEQWTCPSSGEAQGR